MKVRAFGLFGFAGVGVLDAAVRGARGCASVAATLAAALPLALFIPKATILGALPLLGVAAYLVHQARKAERPTFDAIDVIKAQVEEVGG